MKKQFLLEASIFCLSIALILVSCVEHSEPFLPVEHAPIRPIDTVKVIDTPRLAYDSTTGVWHSKNSL
jgi:hypothetical protein